MSQVTIDTDILCPVCQTVVSEYAEGAVDMQISDRTIPVAVLFELFGTDPFIQEDTP